MFLQLASSEHAKFTFIIRFVSMHTLYFDAAKFLI